MKKSTLSILSFILLLQIVALCCNRSNQSNSNGQQNPSAIITMTELTFEPPQVTIPLNGVVRWINTSDLNHTVTADSSLAFDNENVLLPSGAQPFNSENLAPGEEFEYRFTIAGTYRYFCIPHEFAGMTGEVIVEP